MVKILAWIFIFFNVYMGGNFFLNAIGILQDSKYGIITRTSIADLAMAGASVYFMFVKSNAKMALWIGAGAWVLIFFILLAKHHFWNTIDSNEEVDVFFNSYHGHYVMPVLYEKK